MSPRQRMHRTLRLLVCSGALALSACTVGPNFKTPEAPTAGGYAAPGDAPPPADQRQLTPSSLCTRLAASTR